MATNFSESVSSTSDICHDFQCALCVIDELNNEATYHCKKCVEYFCDRCVKIHAKLHRDHEVLGREDVRMWNGGKSVVVMETCEEHAGKEKEMECMDHDTLCCTVCVSKYHRSCQRVEYIPDVAKGIKEKPVFKEFPAKASNITTLLQNVTERKQTNRQAIEKAREEIIGAFVEIQQQMNETIDGLKEKTSLAMKAHLSNIDDALQNDIDAVVEVAGDVKRSVDTIVSEGQENESAIYLGLKKFELKFSEAQEVLQQVAQGEDYKLTFVPNVDIGRFLSSLGALGKFEITGMKKNIFRSRKVPKVVHRDMKKIRSDEDTRTCDIGGLCQLPSDHIAAVDWGNNNVKLLNEQFAVVDVYKMPKYPQKICKIRDTEIAVSVCCGITRRNEVHFLGINDNKLVFQKKLTRHHDCHGIGYQFPNLYIASFTAIYVHTIEGFIKKIYEDTSGEKTTGRIALSDDGDRIYTINNSRHQVLALDGNGKVVSTFENADLKEPIDLAVAKDGGILVCYRRSANIVHVDAGFSSHMVTIATTFDGIHYPRSILEDRRASRLIVGQNSNEILVLKLQ